MNKTNKKFKDPGSAITHLIAMIGAVICAFPLIGKAVHTNNSIVVFAMSVPVPTHQFAYWHSIESREFHYLSLYGLLQSSALS